MKSKISFEVSCITSTNFLSILLGCNKTKEKVSLLLKQYKLGQYPSSVTSNFNPNLTSFFPTQTFPKFETNIKLC